MMYRKLQRYDNLFIESESGDLFRIVDGQMLIIDSPTTIEPRKDVIPITAEEDEFSSTDDCDLDWYGRLSGDEQAEIGLQSYKDRIIDQKIEDDEN